MNIAIVNGPNLNLTGTREPDFYGDTSFDVWLPEANEKFPDHNFTYFQSNHEGELIDFLQEKGGLFQGLILNPGSLAHYGLSLADAVKNLKIPVVEVHLSMVYHREPWRHKLVIAPYCAALITGMGLNGYEYAIQFLLDGAKDK